MGFKFICSRVPVPGPCILLMTIRSCLNSIWKKGLFRFRFLSNITLKFVANAFDVNYKAEFKKKVFQNSVFCLTFIN